jgi:hypothetical protein
MRPSPQLCLVLFVLGAASCLQAQPSRTTVEAVLVAAEKGFLRIVVQNKGREPITFLDAREGSATGATIWNVEIRLEDGRILAPAMRYQPGDPSYRVTIEPGRSYERIIQPSAYVEHPHQRNGPATVVVHYAMQDSISSFSTRPLRLDLSHLFSSPQIEAPAVVQDDLGILQAVARDIEALKPEFPQLRDFSATAHLDTRSVRIAYAFHTHAPEKRGGWTSGVPHPDDDGVWFHIDIHDPDSTLQIHSQPMTAPMCLGDKRVSFLILEGQKTDSLYGPIWSTLARQGAKACAR